MPAPHAASSVEKLLGLVAAGVKKGASDVHIQAGYPPSFRIRGQLLISKSEPLTPGDTLALAVHILGPDHALLKGERHDADRGFGIPGVARLRASIFHQRGSIGMVMRVIPFQVPAIEKLSLPRAMESLCWARSGLVLITGASGNGKSTTIAAMINHMNRNDHLHIVMLEDPIEYVISPGKSVVIQREIGRDADSFAEALRASLRQDPDVLMVGEVRDHETADACLKSAEIGHLVLSSLHTVDVQATIGKFVALFPPAEQESVRNRLADNLKAICSQRLVDRKDGQGQVAAVEILFASRPAQEAIRDPAKTATLEQVMAKSHDDLGTQTFDQHLIELFRNGAITQETALRFATHRSQIERELTIAGPPHSSQ